MNTRNKTLTILLLVVTFIEGLVTFFALMSIPSDPKNIFLFGYSGLRLFVLGVTGLVLILIFLIIVNPRWRNWLANLILSPRIPFQWILILCGVFFTLLWLTLWTPPERFAILEASFTRLRPILIWIELIIVQLTFTMIVARKKIHLNVIWLLIKNNKLFLIYFVASLVLMTGGFYALRRLSPDSYGNQLIFPPGAPLSSLQVFLAWVVFLVIFLIEQKRNGQSSARKYWTVILFLLIWGATFITWNSVKFPCTDDRPGPFPPNNVCYPAIDDAVFSIGSHYLRLGEGINHHWLTEKPLYYEFLAISQWIKGPVIDDYLSIQVAFLALIPALLFLIGRKYSRTSLGLLLSFLSFVGGVYSILLYRHTGSVNVRYENSEVFISLFMLVLTIAIAKWMADPRSFFWGFISGGVLGASVLVRFGPIMIAPIVLIIIFVVVRRPKKTMLPALASFIIAVLLVVAPWFFTANDGNGNNFYWTKIQDVISSRFNPQANAGGEGSPSLAPVAAVASPGEISYVSLKREISDSKVASSPGSGSMIVFHLLNNVYSSLVKFPTTLYFTELEQQVNGPIWEFDEAVPIWKAPLSFENQLAILINLVLLTLGVFLARKKFGVGGFAGLIIVAGYFLGNAVALTSGGRYIEPVYNVLLIYFGMGIYSVTLIIHKIFTGHSVEQAVKDPQAHGIPMIQQKSFGWKKAIVILPFILIGFSLPIANNLPSRMSDESGSDVEAQAYQLLSTRASDLQWQRFITDPQKLIIQGVAFHPAYFRSDMYERGNASFEMMVLGKQKVYVSHTTNVEPLEKFSDGSNVILLGCMRNEDHLWAADRVIMRTYIILQLDKEKSTYYDLNFDWTCTGSR